MKKVGMVLLLAFIGLSISCFTVDSRAAEGVKFPGTDRYGESPLLHRLVNAGQLPPVDQRLPERPMVIQAIQAPGQYIDLLKSIQLRSDKYYNRRIVYESGLIVWSADNSKLLGNIAERWEVSKDATTFTFHLRKGLRWSDGKPFSTDDIEFVVKDIIQNEALGRGFPSPGPNFATAAFTKSNANTFTITLKKPDGNLLTRLASMGGRSLILYQKAYSSQFHPTYNPKAEADAKAAGFGSVTEYFFANCPHFFGNLDNNPARPTMNPWNIAKVISKHDQMWAYNRNPYYFKVDKNGNQLPYAKTIKFYLVDSLEDKLLRSMAGEADFVYTFSPIDRPILHRNMKKGGYKLIDVPFDGGPQLVIGFNRTGPDPELAALAADKRFRIAASVAINRNEICNALYKGFCEPFQAAPLKGTPFYDETFAKQYTTYNPEKANQLLDEIGLDRRNADDIRLLKSGKPLAYTLVFYPRVDNDPDILEFVQRYWRKIGIKLVLKPVDENTFEELMISGQYNISAMTGPNNLYTYKPWAMVPVDRKGSIYASAWYGYLKNKIDGYNTPFVAPDAKTQQAIDWFIKMSSTIDQNEKNAYAKKIVANAREQFYLIGTLTVLGQAGLVKEEMINLESFVLSWQRGGPGNIQPAQWWKR